MGEQAIAVYFFVATGLIALGITMWVGAFVFMLWAAGR